jgi:hypothetical protein
MDSDCRTRGEEEEEGGEEDDTGGGRGEKCS